MNKLTWQRQLELLAQIEPMIEAANDEAQSAATKRQTMCEVFALCLKAVGEDPESFDLDELMTKGRKAMDYVRGDSHPAKKNGKPSTNPEQPSSSSDSDGNLATIGSRAT